MKTLVELNAAYKEIYYTTDEALFSLVVSMVIGAKLNAPSCWCFIVGPTSGGKSTVLSVLYGIPFVELVSDLTPNTFLSGMRVAGKETSLLKRLGDNFVVVMKDFTTMISKGEEAKKQIIAQMREIYDGHIVKETGNGMKIEWGSKSKPSKSMFLMAATEGIYKVQADFADMGTRAINYVMPPQDEYLSTKAAMRNKRNHAKSAERLALLQADVAEFVADKIAHAPLEFAPIPEELEDDIIRVAMLAERARSSIDRDYQGTVQLAQSTGMPMRMSEQMLAIAHFMTYANEGNLTPIIRATIFKVAMDSIPKQRRLVLDLLAKHPRCDIIGMAMAINYPHAVVRKWVEDLNMFKIVDRHVVGDKELWTMRNEYRQTMLKHLPIEAVEDDLVSAAQVPGGKEGLSWEQKEAEIALQRTFDESL